MSGLGTTVQPDGEPGSVTHAVTPQSETVPDDPSQIRQTTAIQTLDQLLNGNWIYDSTFTASTTMPAGTVVYIKPIHPGQWNWPNRRVSTMFNAWSGHGKVRYRPLATAWYGGSIRVGFLPPNIKQADIQSIPLEVLTSYPNKDIDPKNTAWVEFETPDQRDVAYHYMAPFDDTDVRNFGGYVVFYVAGKLVTQAPDFTTIQFIVETAGNFIYDQPGPNALENAIDVPHPLGVASEVPLHLQPLLDSMESGADNILQVLPNSLGSVLAGGLGMSAIGVSKALTKGIPGLVAVADSIAAEVLLDSSSSAGMRFIGPGNNIVGGVNRKTHINREFGVTSLLASAIVPNAADASSVYCNDIGDPLARPSYNWAADTTFTVNGLQYTDALTVLPSAAVTPINPALTLTGYMVLTPNISGESIVIFGNYSHRAYSVQTELMATTLAEFEDMSLGNTSYLYNVVNEAGTPLVLIRLLPNGMFTTSASTVNVVYPAKGLKLKYFGTLPVSSPLPPMTTGMRNARSLMARTTRKLKSDNMDIELMYQELSMF